MWRQPKAVWAVAFASVVAFMGIGLVDPILKPIADNLGASPSQVSLLFTSYMAVMGVAMLVTGVVSSRIGPKRCERLLSAIRAVLQDDTLGGVVFSYRAQGELVGYNLCFVHNGMLLDKYVGFRYPQARDHNLYMVSWFQNLQYAIDNGLTHYVAGWTDPEIKRALGASFTLTQHAVHVRNPVLRTLLKPFKRLFEADASWHRQQTR